MDRKRIFKSLWFWIPIVVILLLVLQPLLRGNGGYADVSTSQVMSQIESGNAKEVTLNDKGQSLEVTLNKPDKDGHGKLKTSYPAAAADDIFNELNKQQQAGKLGKYSTTVGGQSIFLQILIALLPFVLIALVLFFVMSQMQGGGNRVMNFGKSKAKLVSKDTPKTTFSDVAGVDEAIEELQEIKDFLSNPAKFQAIGAKIPKGVLLYGPPGTGKTLLARAVAGEAGVPFYSISGSDFVEMFVGVGASRVRDLFEQAKTNAPAIIFVDEIDAVGRHRGAGLGGGHDEREQTLNQLLVEMDGFDVKGGVILIAATNRPDILDPALLRPGRFDRQIAVDRPDLAGRKQILRVHAKGKPMAADVNLDDIARRTPGFTGADLANVINEGALLTARANQTRISGEMLEEAIDRVVLGPERKNRIISDKEKQMTAYHEGGHALVGWALPNADPVHKVTILSRGRTGGHTLPLPTEDRYTLARSEMIDQLAFALGGRAAEELVFHEPTTGASNDIEKATQIARSMVTDYGMSTRLGAVKYGTSDSEPFLGRDYGHQRDYSDEIASEIDEEVRSMIEGANDEAWEILVQHRGVLDSMVLELIERETLDKDDIARICAPVQKRPPHSVYTGFGKRTPSDRPPIQIPEHLTAAGLRAKAERERGSAQRAQATSQSMSGTLVAGQQPVGGGVAPDSTSGYAAGNGAPSGNGVPPAGQRRPQPYPEQPYPEQPPAAHPSPYPPPDATGPDAKGPDSGSPDQTGADPTTVDGPGAGGGTAAGANQGDADRPRPYGTVDGNPGGTSGTGGDGEHNDGATGDRREER
ncbi:MAG: ATP-dependent zinc metalloprotease FtsH [Mycobacteriales bacterium]